MPVCGSPRLIAACHVLRRLLLPRHSPCALFYLTFEKLFRIIVSLVTELYFTTIRLACFYRFPRKKTFSTFKSFPSLAIHHIPMMSAASLFSFQGTLVGSSGVEPPTSRLSGARSNHLSYEPIPWFSFTQELPGGDEQARTVDPLLAKQVLCQLSYTPVYLRLQRVSYTL